jgi:hypothetical protein
MFKLKDSVYDVLKWLVVIVLPAIGSLWANLSSVWGLPYPDESPKTIMYICTFLGAVLCISTAQYNKDKPPDYSGSYEDLKKDLGWDDMRDSDI